MKQNRRDCKRGCPGDQTTVQLPDTLHPSWQRAAMHECAVRSRVTLKLLHWLFPPPNRQSACLENYWDYSGAALWCHASWRGFPFTNLHTKELAAEAAYSKKGVSKHVGTRPKAGHGTAGLHMAVNLLGLPVSAEQAPQNSHPPHPRHLLGHTSISCTLSLT